MRKRVHEIAEILELQADLPRRAKGLAADVKQKISLGRGLVRPDVAAVLFDEPLTVIDPHVKWLLRRKLKQLHQQLNLSLIYVTHDQTEALTFADQVVVMTQGEVVQVGTPEELFESPAHRFVGHFIGSPGMNFLDCEWHGEPHIGGSAAQHLEHGSSRIRTRALTVGIRPEYMQVHSSPGPNRVPATITAVQDQGTQLMVQLQIGKRTAWSKLRNKREPLAYWPRVRLYACLKNVRSTPMTGGSHDRHEAGQSARLVVRLAGAGERCVLCADSVDDGRELFGAGHTEPVAKRVRRMGVVQGSTA